MHTAGGFLCRVEAKPTRDAEVQQLPRIALSEAAGPRCMPKLSLLLPAPSLSPELEGTGNVVPMTSREQKGRPVCGPQTAWQQRWQGGGAGVYDIVLILYFPQLEVGTEVTKG